LRWSRFPFLQWVLSPGINAVKRALVFSGWAAFGILAAGIVLRAGWVAAHVDGGWDILRDRLVAGLPPVFANKESSENRVWYQAKQRLLDEADRVEKNSSSTADECMGIAWALAGAMGARSSPDPAIVGRLIWGYPPKHPQVDDWHEIDRTLQTRAQHLAAKATSLQPERADWWRLQSLLMVWVSGYAQLDAEGLRQGLEHDPDNALYEYLLAVATMKQAISQKETDRDQGPVHYIADQKLFESGRQLYERAASKKLLLAGEQGFPSAGKFLSAVDAPLATKLMWSNPAGFELATDELIQRIEAPFEFALLEDLPPMETAALTNWLTKNLAWRTQIDIKPETLWLKDRRANPSMIGRQGHWGYIQHIQKLLKDEDRCESLTNLTSIAGIAATAMAVMLLLFALLGGICIAFLRKQSATPRATSFLLAPILFSIVLLLTFGFLGMAGAYQPELREYPWRIGIGLFVIFAFLGWLCALLGRFAWRQSRLARDQRSRAYQAARLALVVGGAIPFLIVLFSLTDVRFREVARNMLLKFPANIFPQTKIDYAAAEALGANWHSIDFAALEWCVRGGAFWTVGITLLLLLRMGCPRAKPDDPHSSRFAAALRYAVRSALRLAFFLMLTSLAVTTWWTEDLQQRYQRDLARLTDHAWLTKLADQQLKGLDIDSPTP
jgi:hypothetical protein